jgi:hypothetical protein
MKVHPIAWAVTAAALAVALVVAPGPLAGQAATPPAGSAKGTLAVAGKGVPLTHAVALNAGAHIYLVITDQALPPNEVKSEFALGMYQFQHKVVGLEMTLDHTRKVTETAYRWDQGKHVCAGCFDVSLAGGADGPLTGTVKTTAKGEAEKLKVDVAFSAPFAKPSAGKD